MAAKILTVLEDAPHNSCEAVSQQIGMGYKVFFATKAEAIGQKCDAVTRPSPCRYSPQGVMQSILKLFALLLVVGENSAIAFAAPAAPVATLQRIQVFEDQLPPSFQLLFSPDNSRLARSSLGGIELWQVQPLQLLAKITTPATRSAQADTEPFSPPLNASNSLRFDQAGWLHYMSESTHAWLTPDLQRGVGSTVKSLSADGRYALRSNTVGAGSVGRDGRIHGAGLSPQYPYARDDIFDQLEKRSVCQLPVTAPADRLSFGKNWAAVQEAAAGPSNPRPLVLCDLLTGRVFAMPYAKASVLVPTLDPQGRWMAVTATDSTLFGGIRVQTQIYALPLRPADFALNSRREECGVLPCGEPSALNTVDAPPANPQTSPDGKWLVGRLLAPQRTVFFDTTALKTVASVQTPEQRQGSISRMVFSRNSRWMGLQEGSHLYVIDLNADKLQALEIRPDTDQFELQDIANDGQHWLMHYRADASSPWLSALWLLKR